MLELIKYENKYFDPWNNFIESSSNGTIFQRLDFLRYHGQRFQKNENHLIWLKGGQIFACLPLGIFKEEKKIARSPFGASWGGLVFGKDFKMKHALEIVDSLINYLKTKKVDECSITLAPNCYKKNLNENFEFALTGSGFKLVNREISNVVRLPDKKSDIWSLIDKKSRNQTKKSLQVFKIKEAAPEKFYEILLEDKTRHRAIPTHELKELEYLKKNLSGKIRFDVAYNKLGQRAGIMYFRGNSKTILTFYMAQENDVRGQNALNALIYSGMSRAVEEKYSYVDFGTTSVKNKIENLGLAEFKEGFGVGSANRDTYHLKIKN